MAVTARSSSRIFYSAGGRHLIGIRRPFATLNLRGGSSTSDRRNGDKLLELEQTAHRPHRTFHHHRSNMAHTVNSTTFLPSPNFSTATTRPASVFTRPSQRRLLSIAAAAALSAQLDYNVYIAVGSNMGDCHHNIHTGLGMLCDPNYHPESYLPTFLTRTSFLYQTAPMYVTNQPHFWNGAVEIATDLDPHALLKRLKWIEQDMGRNITAKTAVDGRNGPRPLDLDILLCYKNDNNLEQGTTKKDGNNSHIAIHTNTLIVPHPRIQEREFVLRPLVDLAGRGLSLYPSNANSNDNTARTAAPANSDTIGALLDNVVASSSPSEKDAEAAVRIIPLPQGRFLKFDSTIIMGILNVTPDSFSDGGRVTTVDDAVDRAISMVEEGASIIDIGGESTRPGAKEIDVKEQIRRTVPAIEAIRARTKGATNDIIISIDTRHSEVARAAVEAGADIVNDVSGGTFDDDMLSTVAELNVPIILMHMRGTPETMQGLANYAEEGGVVESVVEALTDSSEAAEKAGIPRYMQILDVGVGFAKGLEGNLSLLKHYSEIRKRLGNVPLLLGTSRKGFIGTLSGETVAAERDFGTVSSCVAALCLGSAQDSSGSGSTSLGCNVLRVHNVKAVKQAVAVMDAIAHAN